MVDLHIHTNLSDGTDSVAELIGKIEDGGFKVFSVTDHDNLRANCIIQQEWCEFLRQKDIRFISGIELSADYNGKSMHILVYGFDCENSVLAHFIEEGKQLRLGRINRRIQALEEEFQIFLTDEEREWLFSQNNPSKPHLANILITRGLSSDIESAIKKYLYHKFPKTRLDGKTVVRALNDAGMIVGIAHPLGGNGEKRITADELEEKVRVMKDCGIKFLECYYSLYDSTERELIRSVANKYGLKLSGGSDYHGKNKNVTLGNLGIEYDIDMSDLTILEIV